MAIKMKNATQFESLTLLCMAIIPSMLIGTVRFGKFLSEKEKKLVSAVLCCAVLCCAILHIFPNLSSPFSPFCDVIVEFSLLE